MGFFDTSAAHVLKIFGGTTSTCTKRPCFLSGLGSHKHGWLVLIYK
jgi:hypothetical protein